MVRRGWHTSEWSKQWVQVLRGPRPPAAKWPRVQGQSPSNVPDSSRVGLPNTGVRPQTKVTDRVPRRNPEENCAAAQTTVRRLEVALAALESHVERGDPGVLGEGNVSVRGSFQCRTGSQNVGLSSRGRNAESRRQRRP